MRFQRRLSWPVADDTKPLPNAIAWLAVGFSLFLEIRGLGEKEHFFYGLVGESQFRIMASLAPRQPYKSMLITCMGDIDRSSSCRRPEIPPRVRTRGYGPGVPHCNFYFFLLYPR